MLLRSFNWSPHATRIYQAIFRGHRFSSSPLFWSTHFSHHPGRILTLMIRLQYSICVTITKIATRQKASQMNNIGAIRERNLAVMCNGPILRSGRTGPDHFRKIRTTGPDRTKNKIELKIDLDLVIQNRRHFHHTFAQNYEYFHPNNQ